MAIQVSPAAVVVTGGVAIAIAAAIAIGTNPSCTWGDSTQTDGTCMFSDEFNGSSLDSTKWVAEDDMISALLEHGAPWACVRHENVSVDGGNLVLSFTSNARASCPQSWTPTAYYTSNFPSFTSPTATSFDSAIVDARTFHMQYGRVSVRMKMPSGTGPTADVSLWGTNCQNGGAGHQLMEGLFNNVGTCIWPNPGAREYDIPNFTHANIDGLQVIFGLHTNNVNGAPFLRNFFGGPYYGQDWAPANNPTTNYTAFLSTTPISDPTTNWHVYDTDWRPNRVSYFIDGQLYGQTNGAWVTTDTMFPMFWNVDQISASSTGLPVSMLVDYIRISCPPSVPCIWTP